MCANIMNSLQISEYNGSLKWYTTKIRKLESYELLVKILVTGICHTDLHVISGEFSNDQSYLPITPGHEGIGIVVSIGPQVNQIRLGERVGVPWLRNSCLNCGLCLSKQYNLCLKQLNTGFTSPGTFSNYVIADERFVAKIPETIPNEYAAPIICAGLTVYKALKISDLPPNSKIVVSGACGGLGHLAIQYAKILKLDIIALDFMEPHRMQSIKELGVTNIVNLSEADINIHLQNTLKYKPNEKPIMAAIVVAPALSAVHDAIEYVSPGGKIICIGLPKGVFQIPSNKFILKGLTLIGSITGTPEDLNEALKIAAKNKIIPHVMVRSKEEIPKILASLEKTEITGRIVIQM